MTTKETKTIQDYRQQVWETLLRVGKPDSRFHWDFSAFIADFDGNDAATKRILELSAWRDADRVFITPDNSTERLRREAIRAGKTILVTTYGIRRGFLQLDAALVPADEISYAATLDGLDHYATLVTLADLVGTAPLRLLVTGGSAISRNGIRFGKGHGYFDLEWAMLSEIGLTSPESVIVDIVHDDQVIEQTLTGEAHDVAVDWIITPERAIFIANDDRMPGQVFWNLIPGTEHEIIPPIIELKGMLAAGSLDQVGPRR